MAEKLTIARPYAKALFELAFDHGKLAAWSETLAAAAQVAADERVRKLIGNPHVKSEELVELFESIIAPIARRGGIEEHARNLLRTLAANRRLNLLPEIAAVFEKLKAESENTADVVVTTAVPINGELEKQYASVLRNRLRREVRLHKQVDPSVIGGAVLRADDLVIDGSLRGRLERLGAEVAG